MQDSIPSSVTTSNLIGSLSIISTWNVSGKTNLWKCSYQCHIFFYFQATHSKIHWTQSIWLDNQPCTEGFYPCFPLENSSHFTKPRPSCYSKRHWAIEPEYYKENPSFINNILKIKWKNKLRTLWNYWKRIKFKIKKGL